MKIPWIFAKRMVGSLADSSKESACRTGIKQEFFSLDALKS